MEKAWMSSTPLLEAYTVPLTSTPSSGEKRRKNDDSDQDQRLAPLPDDDVEVMEDAGDQGAFGGGGREKEKETGQSEQNMNF